jgi:tRNA-Thr(GGU) m(6)t(6)A37 methyltransferase TsaA
MPAGGWHNPRMSNTDRQDGPDRYTMQVIGDIRSPYKEKFGIPRQPGLAPVESLLELRPGFDSPAMLEGLEGFSHLWLSFVFHACVEDGWRPRVRPPRLGGNRRVGVFASRSPFRPNHLGLSVVELLGIEQDQSLRLRLRGADLLDGTPVLDIKPYLPYVDAIPNARAGFAPKPPATLAVRFAEQPARWLEQYPDLQRMIASVLAQDPRPAYQQDDPERVYGMRLADVNLRFQIVGGVLEVLRVEALDLHGES